MQLLQKVEVVSKNYFDNKHNECTGSCSTEVLEHRIVYRSILCFNKNFFKRGADCMKRRLLADSGVYE
ncbi:MAG: hypothetical protein MPJ25_15455, partial [Pirellulales bacterium]|nr:hypothetical protein [Pirellulales bacterium]